METQRDDSTKLQDMYKSAAEMQSVINGFSIPAATKKQVYSSMKQRLDSHEAISTSSNDQKLKDYKQSFKMMNPLGHSLKDTRP